MLYETSKQILTFCFISLGGFLCGFLFDLKQIFLFKIKKKRILAHFFDFFCIFLTFFACFLLNLKFNFGEIRFFCILGFSLSFVIERFFSQNFLAKPIAKCYNIIKERKNEKQKI